MKIANPATARRLIMKINPLIIDFLDKLLGAISRASKLY
jgi:hypothetical protein